MNIATAVDKTSPFSLEAQASTFLPKKAAKRITLWHSLSLFLLLADLGISFLKPSFFTPYLPFFALLCLASIWRFQRLALISSYMAIAFVFFFFSHAIAAEMRLWQIGLSGSLALTFYIFVLALDETKSCFEESEAQLQTQKEGMHRLEVELMQLKKTAEEQIEEFEEEIQKLKEEAEQRKIEKTQAQRKYALIESEIELLTAQKGDFIEEAKKAKAQAESALHQKTELEEESKKQLLLAQEAILTLQQKPALIKEDDEKVEEVEKRVAHHEGLYNQLRAQFEEKTAILSKTRQELFQTQGKLLALENEKTLTQLDREGAEVATLEKEIECLNEEMSALEKEINALEELVSHILKA